MTNPAFLGTATPAGKLGLHVIRGNQSPGRELTVAEIVKHGLPRKGLADEVNEWRADNSKHLAAPRHLKMYAARAAARAAGLPYVWSQLWLRKITADDRILDLGLAGCRVVTDVGVGFIVDAFQNLVELENMKFHGIGTGSTAEAAGDTALVTELTTQYSTDNTRATGTTAEGASANIYQTVGTNTVDAAVGIQEHGIFDQAATGGGVLLDRTVFAVVNLDNGDSLQSTYELTLPAGS